MPLFGGRGFDTALPREEMLPDWRREKAGRLLVQDRSQSGMWGYVAEGAGRGVDLGSWGLKFSNDGVMDFQIK